MCRAQLVDRGSKEDIRRLRKWVKKGKVWAMDLLAGRYISGTGVKQSDKKAIELYEILKLLEEKIYFCLFFHKNHLFMRMLLQTCSFW